MPGFLDVTQNYCEMVNEKAIGAQFMFNVLKQLGPELYDLFKRYARNCPLSGTHVATMNYTAKVIDQLLVPPGEYCGHYRWFNENNATLYYVRLYTVRHDKQTQS
jgi:hypothetical protein